MLDSRVVLASEKKIFKSVLGTELDCTYKPFILNVLASEYVNLQSDATEAIKKYVELGSEATIEDMEDFRAKTKLFTDCGIKIILATMKANKVVADEEWLQENIALDEFHLLVNYIIGVATDTPVTKKK